MAKTKLHVQTYVPIEWKPLIKNRARKLGCKSISEYLRHLLRKDLGIEDR